MRNVRGRRGLKTEHAGAKNGGGFWGKRVQAKAASRVQRRFDDRVAVDEQRAAMCDCPACRAGYERLCYASIECDCGCADSYLSSAIATGAPQ